MDASNGMVTVEVKLGRPVYRGRAVAGGELVYRAEERAWLQVVKEGDQSSIGAWLTAWRLVRTPKVLAAMAMTAILVALGAFSLRKPGSSQDIKVAEFRQPSVELVNEPFRGAQLPRVASEEGSSTALPIAAYKSDVEPKAVESMVAATGRANALPTPTVVRTQSQDKVAPAAIEPPRAASAAAQEAFVILNRSSGASSPSATPLAKPLRLVAVADENTIVLSNPQNGVPVPFKIGSRLYDGSVLKAVDLRSGIATTDKGVLKLE